MKMSGMLMHHLCGNAGMEELKFLIIYGVLNLPVSARLTVKTRRKQLYMKLLLWMVLMIGLMTLQHLYKTKEKYNRASIELPDLKRHFIL